MLKLLYLFFLWRQESWSISLNMVEVIFLACDSDHWPHCTKCLENQTPEWNGQILFYISPKWNLHQISAIWIHVHHCLTKKQVKLLKYQDICNFEKYDANWLWWEDLSHKTPLVCNYQFLLQPLLLSPSFEIVVISSCWSVIVCSYNTSSVGTLLLVSWVIHIAVEA